MTIVGGFGIIFAGATELAQMHVHPAAITWMVLFSMLTLFGSTALLLRFWFKTLSLQRPSFNVQQQTKQVATSFVPQQLPPRYEGVPSVTEHTTRTFTPIYREPSDPG
jgi:hypothetical protein